MRGRSLFAIAKQYKNALLFFVEKKSQKMQKCKKIGQFFLYKKGPALACAS